MISCTEFIPAYSEGFKFLENRGGSGEVEKFWEHLSDLYLKESLKKYVENFGLEGCYIYWMKTLNEEAADFKMMLNEDKDELKLEMYKCPSKGILLDINYMKPYKNYCGHCPAIYSRVLDPLGYEFIMDLSCTDEGKCSVLIRKIKGRN